MSEATAKSKPIVLPRVPKGLGPRVAWCIRAMAKMAAASGMHLQIIGARRASHDGDLGRFEIDASGGGGSGSDKLNVDENGIVTPSTVGGVMPTIGGVALDHATPPALSISGSGTRYIVINISGTLNSNTYSGSTFIGSAMTSVTVTITVETTEPTGDDLLSTTGSFKILLATFVDGVKLAQAINGPVQFIIHDVLDGSGTGYLTFTSN